MKFSTRILPLTNFFTLITVTAASSNEDSSGGRTFLHFKMLMQNNSGKTETVHLELAPVDFYRVLHEMERAKNNLEVLVGSSSVQS